jgi:hypothetical protein
MSNSLAIAQQNPAKTAQVALSVFFNITKAWKLKAKEQRILLGQPSESTFFNWKKGNASSISKDTLERVSYIMGIYKALGMLFTLRSQADSWIKRPNKAFNDQSALEYMLNGSMINLNEIRRYLDAQRG